MTVGSYSNEEAIDWRCLEEGSEKPKSASVDEEVQAPLFSDDPERLLDSPDDSSFEEDLDENFLLDSHNGSRMEDSLPLELASLIVSLPLDVGVPDTRIAIHTVSSSEEDDMEVEAMSGIPQELLSTGNHEAPVFDVASDSSGEDSVVEFGNTIVFNTVDSSADEDSGLADMVGGPGLGYHEDRSATSRPSDPAAPEAMYPGLDLRDRNTSRGMARRQDTLRADRTQPQRPRHRPNHQMQESMRPSPSQPRLLPPW